MKNPLKLQNLTPQEKTTRKKSILQATFLIFACAIIMFFPGLTFAGDLIEIKPIVSWVVKALAAMAVLGGGGGSLGAGFKLFSAKSSEESADVPKAKAAFPWTLGFTMAGIVLWGFADKLGEWAQGIVTSVTNS